MVFSGDVVFSGEFLFWASKASAAVVGLFGGEDLSPSSCPFSCSRSPIPGGRLGLGAAEGCLWLRGVS